MISIITAQMEKGSDIMARPNSYNAVEANLIENGWEFSHEATVHKYVASGTVSPMRPVGGFEWCRVHTGKSVGKHGVQVTRVYKRELK